MKSPSLPAVLSFLWIMANPGLGQVEDFVTGIEVDTLRTVPSGGGAIFWKFTDPADGPEFYRRNLDEGSLALFGSLSGVYPGSFSTEERHLVYTVEQGGSVVRLNYTYSQVLGTTPNPAGITSYTRTALGSSHFLWSETPVPFEFPGDGKIYRIPLTGGSPELLWDMDAANEYPRDLTFLDHDQRIAVLTSSGRLVELYYVVTGSPPFQLRFWAQAERAIRVMAMERHGDRLYWVDGSSDGKSLFFRSAPLSDLTSVSLHGLEFRSAGGLSTREMTVTDESIYYQPLISGSPGGLRRKPIDGGSFAEIAVLGTRIFDLQNTAGWVIWGKNATTISRISESATPLTRNLGVAGLEVIQAIQGPTNDVGLVAGKSTFARAFGRLISSSSGESSLALSPGMVLHGTDGSGAKLPFSPLSPVRNPPITPAFPDREDMASGHWFRLPDEWTRVGQVTLRAEVNESRVLSETTRADNSVQLTRTFVNKVPVCMVMIPTVSHRGTYRRYHPRFQQTFDYLETLLPTSELRVDFVPGDQLDEAGHLVWEHSPFEFETDVDDDKDKVITGLFWKKVFGSGGPHAEPDGGFDHYVSMIPDHPGAAYSGYARRGTDVITEGMSLFFFNENVSSIDVPQPATTQAQELSHNYGRWHVDCGDPDTVDTNYWYPADTLSDEGHLGWDPLQQRLIAADVGKDYMSYCGPKWVSPYTWHEMSNRISTRSTAAASRAVSSGEAATVSYRMISGLLGLHGHETEIFPAVPLTAAEAARATAGLGGDGTALVLRAFDGGVLQGTWPAISFEPLLDDGAHSSEQYGFAGVVEGAMSATRIEIAEAASPATPVATLTGGGDPPEVSILSPVGGPTLTEPFTIVWSSGDDGAAALAHLVRYSPDNGATWTILTQNFGGSSLTVDPANLQGSVSPGSSVVEVLAGDGLLTGSARSDGFTIPNKAPAAFIFFEGRQGRSPVNLAHATFQCGEPVGLRGVAHDIEEGEMADAAFAWSLSGRAALGASGQNVWFDDLPPGEYLVNLRVTDASGSQGTATAGLTVEPRYIPAATGAVSFDGRCGDPGYAADPCRTEIRYPDSGGIAGIAMVRGPEGLHFCVEGLEVGARSDASLSVYVDANHNRSFLPEESDLRFDVRLASAEIRVFTGRDFGWSIESNPSGFQAVVGERNGRIMVEGVIALERLGAWDGRTVGMAVQHRRRDAVGDDHYWPAGAMENRPSSWAAVVLGTNPDDPSDINDNGLPDQWELEHHGTLVKADQDLDGDGQSEEEEYVAGTHPGTALSRFTAAIGPGPQTLQWESAPGRSYEVWRSLDLRSFEPLESGIPAGTEGQVDWTDPDPPPVRAFYQVRAVYFR